MSIQRIIIKIGTQVLVNKSGNIDNQSLNRIAETVVGLKKRNFDVVIVSSGAIALGALKLGVTPPLTMSEKQASASVGQGLLMKQYEQIFESSDITCGQILVTGSDFSNRSSFLNLRDTFETLLKFGVVPVVNENDSVSTAELEESEQKSFGDNDKLSAIVASKIEADLLIILTNVDGVYNKNPKVDPSAQRIKLIKNIDDLKAVNSEGKSDLGRGGMAAKLEAAKTASICGVGVLITSIEKLDTLNNLSRETAIESLTDTGTVLLPSQKLKGKKKWIGTSSGFKALVVVNEGAKRALVHRNASLLSVGVVSLKGEFEIGDIISIRDDKGGEVARGLAKISSSALLELLSKPRDAAAAKSSHILIHRDQLALFAEQEHIKESES